MRITVTHRLDDTYIEKAWKHAEMEEIEDLAAGFLGKAQEAQSIEDDLFCKLGVLRISYGPIPYIRAMGVLQQEARKVLSYT